jgi:GNAT superfamily N-acetyltransferase
MISVIPMKASHAEAAAAMFIERLGRQRRIVAALPAEFLDAPRVTEKLRWLASTGNALAAVQGDRLVGYLGWFLVPAFRGTSQKAAYGCEWGHATIDQDQATIYRLLYSGAAARWQEEGCGTHALTTLACDTALHQFLFWNGFGLAVVDAMALLGDAAPESPGPCTYRMATEKDIPAILSLDAQLAAHLSAPSVCMPRRQPRDEARQRKFLAQEDNAVWLAEDGTKVVGLLRLEGRGEGACEIVRSPDTVGLSGAYVLEPYRGRGAAAGLLAAATRGYRAKGYTRCSVDWESYNPAATGFWLKHFAPVCYSLIRHVENGL